MNSTTGGPYTYDISDHHFWGTAFDGSWIDTRSACCGSAGDCRDNPSCVCQYQVGPLPPGTYSLGNMFTYKGMPYCYELYPSASNDMCGRGGFLIHGGDCYSGNPSIGCIVIPDQNTRYMIKSGATLYVQKQKVDSHWERRLFPYLIVFFDNCIEKKFLSIHHMNLHSHIYGIM